MAHAFYMDVHVPVAVTAGLRRRGVDVLTAQEDGARELDDELLLHRATSLGRILFTQDKDLLGIATAWQVQSRAFAGVVFCHQLNLGIGRMLEDLELLATCATNEELRSFVTYIPLS